MFHDCGELRTGDLPFPAKTNNPELKKLVDAEEKIGLAGMGVRLPVLSAVEKLRVRYCDLMDMHEYGLVEVGLGNKLAAPIIEDTWDAVVALQQRMSAADRQLVAGYLDARGILFRVEKWRSSDVRN